jgi:hypothetical protein
MRAYPPFVVIAASLVALVAVAPAHATGALREHAYVAAGGVDGNSCSFTEPCQTFAYALTQVVSGGEITAVDSVGYGPLNITQSVTITSAPGVEASVSPITGGASITINANASNVTLRGLTINGIGVGNYGIQVTSTLSGSNSTLNVIDCLVSNFVDSGIAILPTSSSAGSLYFVVANTSSFNNGADGISVVAGGNATILGTITGSTVADNATYGFDIEGASAVTVVNSVVTANFTDGIFESASLPFTMRDTVSHFNYNHDVFLTGGTTAYLYHNTIRYFDMTGATVYTDGTNQILSLLGGTPTKQSTY